MEPAEQTEVLEFRRPAVSPMHDMVGVDPARVVAAGEAASLVTPGERSSKRPRDRAGAPADVEHRPVGPLDDGHHAGVAAQAAHGRPCEPRPILDPMERAGPVAATTPTPPSSAHDDLPEPAEGSASWISEGVGFDVEDDLGAIATRASGRRGGQEPPRPSPSTLGVPLTVIGSDRDGRQGLGGRSEPGEELCTILGGQPGGRLVAIRRRPTTSSPAAVRSPARRPPGEALGGQQ